MKRDMNLIRELLLYAEEHARPVLGVTVSEKDLNFCETEEQLLGHINLLVDAGLMVQPTHTMDGFRLGDLTSSGHDFINSVRDPKIWRETKSVAKSAGGWTIGLLSEIAKGLVKTQIKKLTGVEI